MRICLDARSIRARRCGVSRYARELVSALARVGPDHDFVVYTRQPVDDLRPPPNVEMRATGLASMNPLDDVAMASHVRRDAPSVLHVLHGWLPLVLPRHVPTVMTLHDVFVVTDPEFFAKRRPFDGPARTYFRWLIGRSLGRCQYVITDSHYSKREIRRAFPSRTTPIAVAHLAPYDELPTEVENAHVDPIGQPFVLYVGNFRSYKDIDTLIKGFALYRAMDPPGAACLVLASSDPMEAVLQFARAAGVPDSVIVIPSPDDAMLRRLYRRAQVLVQPSLYEGFGLAPLEAMTFGVPVIISDAECLVEVCGAAARVFPRRDARALSRELAAVLSDPWLQEQLRTAGAAQASRYSWEATALTTLQVYRQLAGSPARS